MTVRPVTIAGSVADVVRGVVITPGDAAYDRARRTFNGMIDRRPHVIVRPLDVADVSSAVRWAADAGLPVAVRGGGHGVAGHAMPDGALVIDLSGWRGAEVDPVAGTAEALGGSLLMDLDAATSAFGLAAPSGTFVDTGIAGLTLTGGISYLAASEGFACDALLGAELVTADGSVIEVDAEREPDLLWALRGGGGNFGVVTRLRYRLTPVAQMYAGLLHYRGDRVVDVLTHLFELDRDAPDALTTGAVAGRSDELGTSLAVVVAWRGDAASGAEAIRSLREQPGLYEDAVHEMGWLQLQAMNAPIPFGLRNYWKGHLVRETSPALARAILDAADAGQDHAAILVEPIHGAAHRIPAASAAFGGRRAVANVTALGIWQDPAVDDERIAWARAAAAAFEPYSLGGAGYLNYPEVDQSAARVAAAFGPEAFERLRRIKGRHDPTNQFRFNANIPPLA